MMEINDIYQFKLNGRVNLDWKDWFPDLTVTYETSNTILTGNIRDHSELYGIIIKFRDLGLKLIAFNQIKEK